VKAFKDPLYIRILSGMFFAGAFIWVAVRYFQVDVDVIYVFLIMSVIFVAGLIVLGLVFSVLLRLMRRRSGSGLLDAVSDSDAALSEDSISAASLVSAEPAVGDTHKTPEDVTAPQHKKP
jgi:hypothetical protein